MRREAAWCASVSGVRCHLPTANVVYPRSRSTSASVPFSGGITALMPGKPWAPSTMHAIPLRWQLRPVSNDARVGEHSAVVCHWVKRTPMSARRFIAGVSITGEPKHSNAARPASSQTM